MDDWKSIITATASANAASTPEKPKSTTPVKKEVEKKEEKKEENNSADKKRKAPGTDPLNLLSNNYLSSLIS